MEQNYAVIDTATGNVINMLVWDGESEFTTDPGTQLVQTDIASIGWTYVNGVFSPPPPPPPVVLTPSQILAVNTSMRNALLANATAAIAPLQDAVDIGEATADDTVLLTKWKTYRVAVNRVVLTIADPTWPTPPDTSSYTSATTGTTESA